MAKSGRAARAKGLAFEREIAILFREIFPHARRHLENHALDANGVDIDHTGPYRIQCKKCKEYKSVSTINEIKCERAFGEVPVLITAGDGKEAMAVLPLSDFVEMLRVHKNLIDSQTILRKARHVAV
jgi:hypothetical protein